MSDYRKFINQFTKVLLVGLVLTCSSIYAAQAQSTQTLGEIDAQGTVYVTLSDGSEITLNNGEKYPLYPDSVIKTDDDSKAVLNVKGGKYVIEQNSTFKANDVSSGNTGLSIVDNAPGEVCYCFQPNAYFVVDTPVSNTVPVIGEVELTGEVEYVQGRTDFTDGSASAYQLENKAEFSSQASSLVLEPGDVTSYPQIAEGSDSNFESKDGCCTPGGAAVPASAGAGQFVPLGIAAAVLTGTIIGASTIGDGDGNSSDFAP